MSTLFVELISILLNASMYFNYDFDYDINFDYDLTGRDS